MALKTFSKFYYGYSITASSPANNIINFDEGSGELTAIMSPGNYTLTEILSAVKTAMDGAGTLEYTVSVNRNSRQITISSTASFDLLTNTGTAVGISPWSILGFSTAADHTGASSYLGETSSGKVYYPQFILQDYKDPTMRQERIDASINESASGKLETVFFGVRNFIDFSLKFITDLEIGSHPFYNNPNGKADAVAFLNYLSTKGGFEFMPDKNNAGSFFSVLVDAMPGSSTGVGYELTELVGQNLPDIYEITNIQCRVI